MELRRQHRIVYQSKIILSTAGRASSVVARVQNLSPLGVFVTTSAADLPRPGTVVLCRFTLARQSRTVRGRVAWVREISKKAPLRSPGAGIEFLDLEERDVDLLRRLVDPGDDERQPVDVWFEGMPTAVRCQATVAGEEVRLATTAALHAPALTRAHRFRGAAGGGGSGGHAGFRHARGER